MYTAQDTIKKRHEIKRQRPRHTNLMQRSMEFLLVEERGFPPPPYTFGSGNKSWLFTFSLWIFGILEWLILNKKVFVGFLPEAPPFGKLFWTESDSTLRVTLVWGHFLGCFPLYLVYISIKDFVSALYRWYCCSESLSSYTVTVHTDNDLAAVVSMQGIYTG